jgi:hypothetical protein
MRYLLVALISAAISSIATLIIIKIDDVLKREAANSAQFNLLKESERRISDYKNRSGEYPKDLTTIFPNSSEKDSLYDIFYKRTPEGYILLAKLPATGWLISNENTAEQGAAANP